MNHYFARRVLAQLAIAASLALADLPTTAQEACFTKQVEFQSYIAGKAWSSVAATGEEILTECGSTLSKTERLTIIRNVASALFRANRFQQASEKAEDCVRQDASSAECWITLADSYRKLKNNRKAHDCYQTALTLLSVRHDEISQFLAQEARTGWYQTRPPSRSRK